jgi:hypothetical protein
MRATYLADAMPEAGGNVGFLRYWPDYGSVRLRHFDAARQTAAIGLINTIDQEAGAA